jgi:hypothetical protein
MATPELQPLGQAVTNQEPASPSLLVRLLGNAKKFADLGIAIPALLYTCGFVVLGCYAEQNNLGLQVFPAIQFFSAGAGFLIVFASVVLVVMFLRLLLKKTFAWLGSEAKLSRLLRKIMPGLLLGSIAASIIASKFHLDTLSLVATYGSGLALFFSAEGWAQKLASFYVYFIAFVVGLALLAFYAFSAYPRIPASFGGGKPRHAYIQVDAKAISAVLSPQLIGTNRDSTAGLATFEADVYLVTDGSIVVKVPRLEPVSHKEAASQVQRPPMMVLQLRRSDVSAIFWDSNH